MSRRFRIGFVMNPVAGLGGPLGFKGSDDTEVIRPAMADMRLEDTPSFRRTVEAFSAFPRKDAVVVTAPGLLGAEALKVTISHQGPIVEVLRLGVPAKAFGDTTAQDTRRFAAALAEQEIDLLVFAGGDGTALDVAEAVAGGVPILGIPTGVKMFSGVFAQTPAMVREIIGRLDAGFPTKETDVLDLDERSYRDGTFIVRSHALARIPQDEAVQASKGGGQVAEGDALEDLVAWFDAWRRPGVLYVVGAGSTTKALKDRLGGGTPLGVDAYLNGRAVALDADAATLEGLVDAHDEAWIVVSPTGTQGCIFGRGTAQISPEVLRAVGPGHVVVVSTPGKLVGLRELFVDTGDADLDAAFDDYIRVRTDPRTEKMFRLRKAATPPPSAYGPAGPPRASR